MARVATPESWQTSLPRMSMWPCVALPPRPVSPYLRIQLPPTDPHFRCFPLKEKCICQTAERISEPHDNAVRQLGGVAISQQYCFIGAIQKATTISILNPNSFAKCKCEAPSRSLPSPPSATYWNCPPGILSRQGNRQNKRLFLPFLFGCLQAGCQRYSLVHGF